MYIYKSTHICTYIHICRWNASITLTCTSDIYIYLHIYTSVFVVCKFTVCVRERERERELSIHFTGKYAYIYTHYIYTHTHFLWCINSCTYPFYIYYRWSGWITVEGRSSCCRRPLETVTLPQRPSATEVCSGMTYADVC